MALAVAAFVLIAHPAFTLDDLFEERDEVREEEAQPDDGEEVEAEDPEDEEPEPDPDDDNDFVDVGAMTTRPTQVSGSVQTGIGAALSLLEWPFSEAAEDDEFGDLFDYTGGYTLSSSVSVDARPQPNLRFNARIRTSLDEDEMDMGRIEVSSLFVDYTLADTYFFRLGKFGFTWGQGRVLGNPGNLVSDTSDGMTVRLVVPAGRGSVTGAVFSNADWVEEFDPASPRAFAYAGQYETSLDAVSLGLSARVRATEPLQTSTWISSGIGDFDLTLEATNKWDRAAPFDPGNFDMTLLSQVLWEGGDPSWVIVAEHLFDTTVPGFAGHRAGLVLRMPRISLLGTRWRPQMRARHAFVDHSGEIVTGLTTTIADDLNMSVGLPVRYGPPDSVYREGDFGSDVQNLDGVAAFGVGLTLSFSF